MSRYGEIFLSKFEEVTELSIFSSIGAGALINAGKSVEMLDVRKQIVEILGDESELNDEAKYKHAVQRAKEVEAFGKRQLALEGSYLYELCVTRLWTILESLVDELVVEALKSPEKCSDQRFLHKLKGPLIEIINADEDERAEFLAESLKLATDSSLKKGVGRFESLLSPIGFGGEIHEVVRRRIIELGQVRNLIVHKSGKVDRHFKESCPWLDLPKGARLVVGKAVFEEYLIAVYWYLVEIKLRVGRCLDMDIRFDGLIKMKAKFESSFADATLRTE